MSLGLRRRTVQAIVGPMARLGDGPAPQPADARPLMASVGFQGWGCRSDWPTCTLLVPGRRC